MTHYILCSQCFHDEGLRLDAEQIGILDNAACPSCRANKGRKLTEDLVARLAHRFFVWGTLQRCEYGAAPRVQFNDRQSTSIDTSPWFRQDLRLIERAIGVGFFYYGPRLWMVGEIEPLKALERKATRSSVIGRILNEYPPIALRPDQTFYRIRRNVATPANFGEYDSPPIHIAGSGRLDSKRLPVMYGSQDLQVCIHECRVTAEDELFVATLAPTRTLKLLDLTELLREEDATEFESLDMAVHIRIQ